MNFEAWQMQQKAQKDEERLRKSQAAEALRSYKGDATTAEATKVALMKEQERQKKLEAERQLREYRGGVSEGDTKLSMMREEERRKKQEAANMLRGYQASLSEEEAKLAALREEERRKKQEAQQQLYSNLESTNGDEPATNVIAAGSVSAMTSVFNASPSVPTEEAVPTFNGSHSPEPTTEAVAPNGDSVPPSEAPEFPSPGEPDVPIVSPPTAVPPPVVAPTLPMSLQFMFGVIAVAGNDSVDAYLVTIDQIINNTIGMETKQTLNFEYPSVLNIRTDGNFVGPRPDVMRRLVTAEIRYKAFDEATGEDTKKKIIMAIQSAIQSGTFKRAY